ncbi:chromatin remodeling complex protein [Lactarius psammicola]|nr:chromatin remodeling complex protein [Lactarius psammicola]
MPTCRRKRVLLTEPLPSLLQALKSDPNRHCEVTGKSGLDYFQALESEQLEARTMHSRFPEQLKPAILKAVQWQVMGRLDHLVEAVYERYKDRYFRDEKCIYVDIQGDKFVARVVEVFLPRLNVKVNGESTDAAPVASTSSFPHANDQRNPHQIHGDLKISAKRFNAVDDPIKKENQKDETSTPRPPRRLREKWNGSIMKFDAVRDRLAFSKSILRRFIPRLFASPWTVKPPVAVRYGARFYNARGNNVRVSRISKKARFRAQKKSGRDKEGPTKKQKKLSAAREEKGMILIVRCYIIDPLMQWQLLLWRKSVEAEKLAKAEAQRQAAEKKKKKPYPISNEDLDVTLSEKERKNGMKVRRPVPSRSALPFNDRKGSFESMPIRHTLVEPSCQLIAEVHSSLIYNLRTVAFQRHSAVGSLMSASEDEDDDNDDLGVTVKALTTAMADVGNNWERTPLRHSGRTRRVGRVISGCIKDHATLSSFPTLRRHQPSSPKQCYPMLPPEDKIAILAFMCNVAVSSKSVHAHMEACEEELTSRRKEKIELNRTRKALIEAREALLGDNKESAANGADDDTPMNDLSELSDVSASENGSEQGTAAKKGTDLRRKAQSQAHAKQREAARAKAASIKQAMAEHRRLDEEVNKLERRLEGIEREFPPTSWFYRFYNRIWWFDGMGAASLLGSGGIVQYGTGRLFVQGPSAFDQEILDRREEGDVRARRLEEEGEDGMLGVGEWGVYTDLEEVDELTAWLNPKGNRELALRNTLTKWAGATDISRAPYMTWTNRKAVSMA